MSRVVTCCQTSKKTHKLLSNQIIHGTKIGIQHYIEILWLLYDEVVYNTTTLSYDMLHNQAIIAGM